jgi:hypothetical protein
MHRLKQRGRSQKPGEMMVTQLYNSGEEADSEGETWSAQAYVS